MNSVAVVVVFPVVLDHTLNRKNYLSIGLSHTLLEVVAGNFDFGKFDLVYLPYFKSNLYLFLQGLSYRVLSVY